jgi:hypothetical protein
MRPVRAPAKLADAMTPDEAAQVAEGLKRALGLLRKARPRTREIALATAAVERSLALMRFVQQSHR